MSNWNLCEDKMPQKGEEVLVKDKVFGYMVATYSEFINAWGNKEMEFLTHYSLFSKDMARLNNVEKWMYIPQESK